MSDSSNTLVSIVIPAYNAESYLEETAKAVLAQNHSNLEVLIAVDGATDRTLAIAEDLAASDERVEVIAKENSGVSDSRNVGFAKSKGEFVAFLDADDVWKPSFIEESLAVFSSDDAIGMVHSTMQVIDADSAPVDFYYEGIDGHILDEVLLWEVTTVHSPSCILVRRDVVEDIGGFDVELSTAADQEFFQRVAARYKIGRVKSVQGFYRVHDQNMHKNIDLMERDHILAYKRADENEFFKGGWFRRRCYSNLYMILAASWWVDGQNKIRGLWFMLKAIAIYPPSIFGVTKKLIGKI